MEALGSDDYIFRMKLRSEFKESIYWRTFKPGDTVHIVGLSDGILQPGETVDIHENEVSFQLEVKWNIDGQPFLEEPSVHRQRRNDESYVIVKSGTLEQVLPLTPTR